MTLDFLGRRRLLFSFNLIESNRFGQMKSFEWNRGRSAACSIQLDHLAYNWNVFFSSSIAFDLDEFSTNQWKWTDSLRFRFIKCLRKLSARRRITVNCNARKLVHRPCNHFFFFSIPINNFKCCSVKHKLHICWKYEREWVRMRARIAICKCASARTHKPKQTI